MKLLNSKGQPVVLNAKESRLAAVHQRIANDFGYEVQITTLTTIMKAISEQKFYHIPFADYVPVRVGQGAWSSNLTTYRSFQLSDEFETGIINTGGNNARLASGDAGVDSLNIKVINWAKSIGWSIPDLELAAKSGNWDLITAKEESRKTNWDLGLQRIAFLGARGESAALGLYTQVGVTIDTTTITQPISTMSTAQLKTFCATVLNVYRANCHRTAWPTAFIVPESDFLGLASPASADFPIRPTMSLLEETFQVMTGNKGFKVLPCAYGDNVQSGLGVQRYVLLNQDEKSIRMDIPVDYTNTLANSLDNFSFQNAAYGQFTGVLAYRPDELYYMQF